MTDPIADLLTRIRNAVQARHGSLVVPRSRLKTEIVRILQEVVYTPRQALHTRFSFQFRWFLVVSCKRRRNNLPLLLAHFRSTSIQNYHFEC